MLIKKRSKCAVCNNSLITFFDLGLMPVANCVLDEKELNSKEKVIPLSLCFCPKCYLVQLGQVVDSKFLFENYSYVPSMSKTLIFHFESLCESVVKRRLSIEKVMDIGSNDGTLLHFFKQKGSSVLGVDPALKIAENATKSGILTLPFLFSWKNAQKIAYKHGKYDLITATNVFAHINDLIDLYRGVDHLLSDHGIVIVEVGYLIDMIQNGYFDFIYHEHLYYFSVLSLMNLFSKTNLEIFDIEHIPIHGGSLRIFLKKKQNIRLKICKSHINSFLNYEKKFKFDDLKTYQNFSSLAKINKKNIFNLLRKLKTQKKHIVAFGAPGKGNILMKYCGLSNKILDYVVDSTTYKQYKFTPWNHLQILPEETIYIDKPDYLLILAWNFSDEIVKKHSLFKKHFIVPLPKVKII